jgi:hypothetical protein
MLAPGVLAASFALVVAALGDRTLFGLVNGFPVDSPAVWGGLWEAVSVLGLGLCALLLSLLFGAAQPRWLAAIAWCFATVGVSLHLVKLGFFCVMGGLQFLTTGVLAELLIRVYFKRDPGAQPYYASEPRAPAPDDGWHAQR